MGSSYRQVAKGIWTAFVGFLCGPWFLLVLGAFVLLYFDVKLFYVVPQDVCGEFTGTRLDDCRKNLPEEKFKYGSLNAEADRGIPYPIFAALPRAFPQCLPKDEGEGYQSLGFAMEEGRKLPVGFSSQQLGIERVTLNCAVCHTATYRLRPEDRPVIVPTGPSHTVRMQEFIRFLGCAASSDNFSYDKLWDEISRNSPMAWDDWAIYRVLIPTVRARIKQGVSRFGWMEDRPEWGPGRDDSTNLLKFLALGGDPKTDASTGNADFPAIWNLSAREGQSLNWAGETTDPMAQIVDFALGLGASPGPHFRQQMGEIRAYLESKSPPRYPLAASSDDQQVMAGRTIFQIQCADCHESGGSKFGKVVPVEDVGTDRSRFDSWTREYALKSNALAESMGVSRGGMIKDKGYVAGPLSGLWLRAPYLHNGSVANLRELLAPPDQRLKKFYRGCDLYDQGNVGFVSDGKEPSCPDPFLFDTAKPGNSNVGHDYGTGLPDEKKEQLLEYLKTL